MLGIEIVTDKETKGIPKSNIGAIIQKQGEEKGALFRLLRSGAGYSPADDHPRTIQQRS